MLDQGSALVSQGLDRHRLNMIRLASKHPRVPNDNIAGGRQHQPIWLYSAGRSQARMHTRKMWGAASGWEEGAALRSLR